MTTASESDEYTIYTRGVSSVVYDDQNETIGHTLLLDVDDADHLAIHTAAESLSGRVAVYQSSDGSFHLWSLDVREFEETILDALELRIADADHIQQSKIRERYVLRCAPKQFEDGAVYKPAPELMAVYDDGHGSVSESHEWLVQQHAERDGVDVPAVEDSRLVGAEDSVELHTYLTLTDDGKEAVR